MRGMNDAERIKALGGPTRVARLMSSRGSGNVTAQRVHNWTGRGIPPAVKLAYPDLFLADLAMPETSRDAREVSA